MFVRFREVRGKLQVSLAEARRVDGQVCQEHVAGLGAITLSPTIVDRIVFWHGLHERLAKLGNRIPLEVQGRILGAIHARVPMPTLDEQTATKIEHAEADEQLWSSRQAFAESNAADLKGLAATAEQTAAQQAAAATDAAAKVAAARDRKERLRRGEDVPGGLGKPVTREDLERILRAEGIDVEHVVRVSEVMDELGEELVFPALHAERERSYKALMRRLHRQISRERDGDR